MSRLLRDEEISRQLEDLPDWHRSQDGSAISATFQLTDFGAALTFVNQVADAAEQTDHHPDIDIRWNRVTLVLSTHSEGGLTQLDIKLAHRIHDETGAGGAPD